MKNILVRLFGFRAASIHGDTLMMDQWLWLSQHLPPVPNGSKELLDIGCGTGAFAIGAAHRGYDCLGLSWDARNQSVANQRAALCNVDQLAKFKVLDARRLGEETDLSGKFDVLVCLETIEHILDDRKLMIDMGRCLVPGGRLFLTTPNFEYKPMTKVDEYPVSQNEDGRHVRRGYTEKDLRELCVAADLDPCKIEYCSGFLSQKITAVLRTLSPVIGHRLSCLVALPLRLLPPVFDKWISKTSRWPGFSIALIAQKR
jgi:SAM-dependent methyltransferase